MAAVTACSFRATPRSNLAGPALRVRAAGEPQAGDKGRDGPVNSCQAAALWWAWRLTVQDVRRPLPSGCRSIARSFANARLAPGRNDPA